MTIKCPPYPDGEDQVTVEKMISSALEVDSTWVVPHPCFAYKIYEGEPLCNHPISKMRRHMQLLWESLPAAARGLYLAREAYEGFIYALNPLVELRDMSLTNGLVTDAIINTIHTSVRMLGREIIRPLSKQQK